MNKDNWNEIRSADNSGNPWIDILLGWVNNSILYLSLVDLRIELQLSLTIEDNTVSWSSDLELANTLPFGNMVSLFDWWNATWNLVHPYLYHCYSTNWFIKGIDDKNVSGCYTRMILLRIHKVIKLFDVQVGVLQKISPAYVISLLNDAWNRWMPSVITPGS